jgi:hypothetical protein
MKTRMRIRPKRKGSAPSNPEATSEILILANGTVYAHNITPQMARLLTLLDPADLPMRARAAIPGQDPAPSNFPNSAP